MVAGCGQDGCEAIDNLSTGQSAPKRGRALRECPRCFYETPLLGFFWLWLNAAIEQEEAPRLAPSNIYREGKAKEGSLVSLNELLSVKTPRLTQYYRKCWPGVMRAIEAARRSRGEAPRTVAPTPRDKVIARHWPLVRKKCRIVPQAHRADAIQACMERLVTVWDDWDKSRGTFGTFAAQPIDQEIQDFLKQLRRPVPVQRSINLNDPAPADDDDKPPQPECPDMMAIQ